MNTITLTTQTTNRLHFSPVETQPSQRIPFSGQVAILAINKTHYMQIKKHKHTRTHTQYNWKEPCHGKWTLSINYIHTTEKSHHHKMQNINRNSKLLSKKHKYTTFSLNYGSVGNNKTNQEIMIHIHTTFGKPSVSNIAQPKQRTMSSDYHKEFIRPLLCLSASPANHSELFGEYMIIPKPPYKNFIIHICTTYYEKHEHKQK